MFNKEEIIAVIRDMLQRLEILERSSGGNEDYVAPTLLNSWVNFDTDTHNEAGYFRSQDGIVYLRGLIKSGTVGQTAFTLPAGYRPTRRMICVAISNGAIGRVDIEADGSVVINAGNNTYVSLDGISFRAMQ